MEDLIINCQTGRETRRKFTAAEVEQRLVEIGKSEQDEEIRKFEQTRQRLVEASVRLGAIQALKADGWLEAEAVESAQEEVDGLKAQLKPTKPESVEL